MLQEMLVNNVSCNSYNRLNVKNVLFSMWLVTFRVTNQLYLQDQFRVMTNGKYSSLFYLFHCLFCINGTVHIYMY